MVDNIAIVEFDAKYSDQVKNVIWTTLQDLGLKKELKPSKRDRDLDFIGEIYKDRGKFWVALENDKVIGTIAIENRAGDTAKLRRMSVLSEYQGKGIAQKLFKTAVQFARKKGYKEIELSTAHFMKRAHKFYEKQGFKKIGADEKEYFYKLTLI